MPVFDLIYLTFYSCTFIWQVLLVFSFLLFYLHNIFIGFLVCLLENKFYLDKL